MNIYVGNLPYQITEDELKTAFEEYGEVASVKIVIDRETGRSKGFAFVEMSDDTKGSSAIEELDGAELLGRTLRVNEARPRPQRNGGGGRGGNRGGYNRGPRDDRNNF
jgi:RNA recognition motif-containing protein